MKYRTQLDPLLSSEERRLLVKLSTPNKIQDFLDSFPVNFSPIGEPVQSPRHVLKNKRAHCIEAAIVAAASLAYHGREALLLDLQASNDDEDHVVALFKEHSLWGAISKTNHPQLRWRDPIYQSVHELAMSYFHEYFLWDTTHNNKKVPAARQGKKTLRAYSKPFNLMRYKPARWWAADNLDWLAEELDSSRHFPLVSKSTIKKLRPANQVEIKAAVLTEYKNPLM
ncbi:MAG: hypothetical protein ABSE76_02335 [Minisyncoccia bacterium]|jgi:hypothetical protein